MSPRRPHTAALHCCRLARRQCPAVPGAGLVLHLQLRPGLALRSATSPGATASQSAAAAIAGRRASWTPAAASQSAWDRTSSVGKSQGVTAGGEAAANSPPGRCTATEQLCGGQGEGWGQRQRFAGVRPEGVWGIQQRYPPSHACGHANGLQQRAAAAARCASKPRPQWSTRSRASCVCLGQLAAPPMTRGSADPTTPDRGGTALLRTRLRV